LEPHPASLPEAELEHEAQHEIDDDDEAENGTETAS
jgi:hypothetical protein